jgi:hypothetical protein
MKRVCFDTGSNYFYDPTRNGWLRDPAHAREHFSAKKLRFDCASALIVGESTTAYDFVNAKDFVEFLTEEADEIITYNGRKCDLIVLEHAIGEHAMEGVWHKPHHDLTGWPTDYGLRITISKLLPDLAQNYDSIREDRSKMLIDQGLSRFIALKLADCYRDATFLAKLWDLYSASGSISHTRSNGG